jgi:hypothetical protein
VEKRAVGRKPELAGILLLLYTHDKELLDSVLHMSEDYTVAITETTCLPMMDG